MRASHPYIAMFYSGYTFKSLHEFAWAQEFDARAMEWEYETVIFRTPEGSYKPDFPMCSRTFYIEIKTWGARNVHNRFHLCRAPLLLIFGLPQRCYIRFKPAGSDRFSPGHLKTFDFAYALIRKAAA